jgi:hypothetical protein
MASANILLVMMFLAAGPLLAAASNGGPFWSAYSPPTLQINGTVVTLNGSVGHQPAVNIGPGGQIVLQGVAHLWLSIDHGRSWAPHCAAAQPGNPGGVGILADGDTLLLGKNLEAN